ncbi:MAG: extracellular solute-binding protein [Bacilli bacterium]|nr:extracellular solute-binding protein [Bacilli bacterium]
MKKLCLLALPILVLTSCGGSSEKDGGQDSSGNTIVKVMFHVDGQSEEGMAYKKRINAFNSAYKSQKIKASADFVARTQGTTSYEQVLISMKQEGTLPSIITFDSPNCSTYAHYKLVVNVDDVFTEEEKNEFITLNRYQGKTYGIPIQESSAGFYYNKTIFAEAGIDVSGYTVENPWTFDQFKDVCRRLKDHGVATPVDMRLDATRDETATYLLYPFIYAAGGDFVDENGKVTGHLNSNASKRGFQFFKDLVTNGYTSYSVGATDFFTGKAGMYLSSGWTIPDLLHKYKKNRDEWGLLPYPKDVTAASATGSWSYGLTKDTEAGRALLKWLSTPESAQVITDATGMIPAHKTLGNDYEINSAEYVLRKQLELSGTPRPEMVGYSKFSAYFANIINGIYNQEVNGVVDSFTSSLQTELDKIK